MLIKACKYPLNGDADLSIDIHHNRANVALWVWKDDWFTFSARVYTWEHPSELLSLAIDLAEKHAPDLVADLQDLFTHPDFRESEDD